MVFPLLLTVLLSAFPAPVASFAHPTDSVGVKVQGGKTYLKYQIKKGDTFYSIARQYNLSMAQVVAANPKVNSALRIGQVVLVPRATAVLTAEPLKAGAETRPADKPAAPGTPPAPGGVVMRPAQTHVVKQGETLSSIARKYHTSIAKLRQLNNLRTDALHLKQKLVVTETAVARNSAPSGRPAAGKPTDMPRETVAQAEKPEKAPEPRREETKPDEPAPRPSANSDSRSQSAADDTTAGTEVAESLRKVTESGMAEAIDQSGESNKYLALHRTAPVGTILQVKNPQNAQSVYVRVIGKLPPTGANENVIIRLSKRAVQKLAVVDARFRVEVSYMP